MISFLSGIGSNWVNEDDYEKLMKKYPLLGTCTGDVGFPDREHVKAAYLCAGHAYLSHRLKRAYCLIRSLLDSNDVPAEILCPASIFLSLIAVDMNNFAFAACILQTLVTVPQWTESDEALKNAFALVSVKLNIKKDMSNKCPELSAKKLEDIEWLSVRLESGLRDGSYKIVLNPLLALRKKANNELLVKVNMTIGDLYFRGFENLDISESFYKDALQICYDQKIEVIILFRSIVHISYELGSIMMCNNKPFSAFYTLLIGLPVAAHTPEGWMRLAQTAILCHLAKEFSVRETQEEVEVARTRFIKFYSSEPNRKIANDIIKEEMFPSLRTGEDVNRLEPPYKFAFKCVQKACELVQENTKEWSLLHFDLMTMYIFLSIELNLVSSSLPILNSLVKMNKGGALNKNIYHIFKAKLFLAENKNDEAINELNSVVYPNEKTRRIRVNKERNYCQALDAANTESCYDHAFAFIPIEAMRLKFLYNIIKVRNQVREILRERNLTRGLVHATDKNLSMFE